MGDIFKKMKKLQCLRWKLQDGINDRLDIAKEKKA